MPQRNELVLGYSCLMCISQLTCSLTASQNETAVKNMLYGHLLGNLLPLLIRVLFRWQVFRQSKTAIILYLVSAALSQFLYQTLKRMGTPRRDSTGSLVSPGDDLNQPGMTEWTFDILYISCELMSRHRSHICLLIVCRVCPNRLRYSGRMVLVDIHCGKV
jgi:SRP-independent targeting protein 2/TMEM208